MYLKKVVFRKAMMYRYDMSVYNKNEQLVIYSDNNKHTKLVN